MRAAVVINRGGGSVNARTDEAGIERAFGAAGVSATVVKVDAPDLVEAVRSAVADGVDAVVVGGGDGTISAAAGVLAGREIPLGVLPLGTANHFARDIGLPFELEEAVRVIASGHTRTLSLGQVNGRTFINNSLLGFYPAVAKARKSVRKWLPINKTIVRWIAAARVFPTFPLMQVRMEAAGRTLSCATPFIFIGTNEYAMHVFSFGAGARTDQENLFVYMVRHPSRMSLLKLFLIAFVKDVKQDKHFESWSVPEVTIETGSHKVTVFVDGELIKLQAPLVYRSLPGALRVFVPAER